MLIVSSAGQAQSSSTAASDHQLVISSSPRKSGLCAKYGEMSSRRSWVICSQDGDGQMDDLRAQLLWSPLWPAQRHKRRRRVSKAHSWPINPTWLLGAPFWKRTQILSFVKVCYLKSTDSVLKKYTGPQTSPACELWKINLRTKIGFSLFVQLLLILESFNIPLFPHSVDLFPGETSPKFLCWVETLFKCSSAGASAVIILLRVFSAAPEEQLFRTSANCFICLSEQSRIHQSAVLGQFSVSDQLACHWRNRNELEILIWPAPDWLGCGRRWHVKQAAEVFSRH